MSKRSSKIRSGSGAGAYWLYGLHAVRAALANPLRRSRQCLLTERAAQAMGPDLIARATVKIVDVAQISHALPQGAVHQGAALCCEPLRLRRIEEIVNGPKLKLVLVLDQIEDPQNVGAILRSAAAFDASAVIVQDRHAPSESGALAKAASGALDLVPYIPVVNIARALEQLGDADFWRVALTGDADRPLSSAVTGGNMALVLGSEGGGLRRLVHARCDCSAFIPIGRRMESLNVSNAAAIALYESRRAVIMAVHTRADKEA